MSASLVNKISSDSPDAQILQNFAEEIIFCPCLFGDFRVLFFHSHAVNDLVFVLLFCSG